MQLAEGRRMEARSLSWIWRCGNSERYLNVPLIVQLRYIPSLFLHLTANCAGIEDLLVPPVNMILDCRWPALLDPIWFRPTILSPPVSIYLYWGLFTYFLSAYRSGSAIWLQVVGRWPRTSHSNLLCDPFHKVTMDGKKLLHNFPLSFSPSNPPSSTPPIDLQADPSVIPHGKWSGVRVVRILLAHQCISTVLIIFGQKVTMQSSTGNRFIFPILLLIVEQSSTNWKMRENANQTVTWHNCIRYCQESTYFHFLPIMMHTPANKKTLLYVE